jgi:hypothetical protein
MVCAIGGALLLTHSHSLGNIKEELMAELSHSALAIFAVTAGWLAGSKCGSTALGAELRLGFGPFALSLSESSCSTTGRLRCEADRKENRRWPPSRGPVPLEESLLLGAKSEVDARGVAQVILVVVVS